MPYSIFNLSFLLLIFVHPFVSQSKSQQVCYPSVVRHRIDTLLPTSQLFCVSRSNDDIAFKNVEILQSDEQWEDYAKARGFENLEEKEDAAGKTVMVQKSGRTEYYQLPASISMDFCTGYQQIELNRNISTRCKCPTIIDKRNCENTPYFNARELFSDTNFIVRDANSTSNIELRSSQPVINPQWNGTACVGVVKKATINFLLNDSRIVDSSVDIVYDVIRREEADFELTFDVIFRSLNLFEQQDDNSTDEKPKEMTGYHDGDIIYAVNGMVAVPFSIPTFSDCLTTQSLQQVLFRRSITAVCTVLTSSCEEAKRFARNFFDQIYPHELLSAPSDDSHPALVKAINVTWDEKIISENRCRLPVSSLLQIYTAKQGSTRNYREVIVAGSTQLVLDYVYYNSSQPIRLPISIMFTDVTGEPKSIFLALPYIDIRLPNDFFYPFIKNSSNNDGKKPKSLLEMLFLLISYFLFSFSVENLLFSI